MYILAQHEWQIVNTDYVERFLAVDRPDSGLVIASYGDERPPVTLGRYKNVKEAKEVLVDLYLSLSPGCDQYTMPLGTYYAEERIVHDARVKRKGGS